MNVRKEITESKGRFIAVDGNNEAGEMTFSLANDGRLLIIDHTGVEDEYKGMGVGKLLFDEMVKDARSKGNQVMPLCPFARAMFEKNKDMWDVLRHNSL